MPKFVHERAEHLLAKNPSMPKSEAFAIATQQGEALHKTPKGFGTPEGHREAKAKYPTPKDDKKTANPGHLESPKMAMLDEFLQIQQYDSIGKKLAFVLSPEHRQIAKNVWEGARGEIGPAAGAVVGAGAAKAMGYNPLSGAALGYGMGSIPELRKDILEHRSAAKAKKIQGLAGAGT